MKVQVKVGAAYREGIDAVIAAGNLPGFQLEGYTFSYEFDDSQPLDNVVKAIKESVSTFNIAVVEGAEVEPGLFDFLNITVGNIERDITNIYNARETAVADAPDGKDTALEVGDIAHSDAVTDDAIAFASTQSSVEENAEGVEINGKTEKRKRTAD